MKKLRKALLSAIIVGCMATTLCGTIASAEETGTIVNQTNTLEGTVERVTSSAFILKTADDTEYAVACSNAQDFVKGDTVTVTYSGEVTERQGRLTVVADTVALAGGGATTEDTAQTPVDTPVTETTPETTTPVTTPVVDTNTSTNVDGKPYTPDTGNEDLIGLATIGLVGGIAGGVYSVSKKNRK